MTKAQWKELILRVILTAGAEPPDRSGRTPYDLLTDRMRSLDNGDDEWNRALGAVVEIVRNPDGADVQAWLRLIGLLEELAPLPRKVRETLVGSVEARQPANSDFRAYLIRVLASVDAPIDWERLRRSGISEEFSRNSPLVWADALVCGNRLDEACGIVRHLLSSDTVTAESVAELLSRWSYRLPNDETKEIFNDFRDAAKPAERHIFDEWARRSGHGEWASRDPRPLARTRPSLMGDDERDWLRQVSA